MGTEMSDAAGNVTNSVETRTNTRNTSTRFIRTPSVHMALMGLRGLLCAVIQELSVGGGWAPTLAIGVVLR